MVDAVAALVLGGQTPLDLLLVNGVPVIEQSQLLTVDPVALANEVDAAIKTLLSLAGR